MPLPRQFLVRHRLRTHLTTCIARLNSSLSSSPSLASTSSSYSSSASASASASASSSYSSSASASSLTYSALLFAAPALLPLALACTPSSSPSSSSSSRLLSTFLDRGSEASAALAASSSRGGAARESWHFSWVIFILGILHCLVWSVGVTESFSRDFFARQQFSLTGGTGFPEHLTHQQQQHHFSQHTFHRQLEATRALFLTHLEQQVSHQRALDSASEKGATGGLRAAHPCHLGRSGAAAALATFPAHFPNTDDESADGADSASHPALSAFRFADANVHTDANNVNVVLVA